MKCTKNQGGGLEEKKRRHFLLSQAMPSKKFSMIFHASPNPLPRIGNTETSATGFSDETLYETDFFLKAVCASLRVIYERPSVPNSWEKLSKNNYFVNRDLCKSPFQDESEECFPDARKDSGNDIAISLRNPDDAAGKHNRFQAGSDFCRGPSR